MPEMCGRNGLIGIIEIIMNETKLSEKWCDFTFSLQQTNTNSPKWEANQLYGKEMLI